jgi:hypothetical protein
MVSEKESRKCSGVSKSRSRDIKKRVAKPGSVNFTYTPRTASFGPANVST